MCTPTNNRENVGIPTSRTFLNILFSMTAIIWFYVCIWRQSHSRVSRVAADGLAPISTNPPATNTMSVDIWTRISSPIWLRMPRRCRHRKNSDTRWALIIHKIATYRYEFKLHAIIRNVASNIVMSDKYLWVTWRQYIQWWPAQPCAYMWLTGNYWKKGDLQPPITYSGGNVIDDI